MNMKKLVILSMLLLLVTVAFAAPRSYFQKVVAGDPGVDILTLVTSTLTSYTAPNYTVTADIVETAGEVLSTGVTVTTSLRLNKTGNGTTVPYYAVVFVQLSTFPTPFVNGQTLRIVVTKTDVAGNPSTTWDQVIPTGTAAINITTPTQNIPPLFVEPLNYDATVTSNLAGKAIFDGGIDTAHVTPFTFSWPVGSSHTITVAPDPLYTTPAPQTITAAGTYTFTYVLIPVLPPNTAEVTPGAFTYPN